MDKLPTQIRKFTTKYSSFKLIKENPIELEGEVILFRHEYGVVDSYRVGISFPKTYPFKFPIVNELEGKIPRETNRHVNPDRSLCMAVRPEERMICRKGIDLIFFFERVLTPHLFRETFRRLNGVYPDGEYDHFTKGIWQYYEEIFGFKDKARIIECLEFALEINKLSRNEGCFCNSGLKLKDCHLEKLEKVCLLGPDYLRSELEELRKDLIEAV